MPRKSHATPGAAALSPLPQPVRLRVRVQPGASRQGCAGMHGDRLKIRLRAPAVDGKANEALLDWLAVELAIPANALRIVAGEKSREKTIEISGKIPALESAADADADHVRDLLLLQEGVPS